MKVGILGAGGMGNVHARHLSRLPGVEVLVFDTDADKAKALAARWGCQAVESTDSIFDKADAIDVCLPTHLHYDLGMTAIETGKAVFIEKPLASSTVQARRLIEAAAKNDVMLAVGHVVRFFPEFRRAREAVRSGAIGTPSIARTRRGGLAPKSPWFADYTVSGGVLLDLAIHDFDWLRWTLGEVASVYAKSVGFTHGSWPDYALSTLIFESGAVAHVESTWMDPGGGRVTFEVCGSGGMIEHDSRKTQTLRTSVAGSQTALESPLDALDDPYYNQLKNFVECVNADLPPAVPGEEGFKSLAVALAAVESAKTGKPVRPDSI